MVARPGGAVAGGAGGLLVPARQGAGLLNPAEVRLLGDPPVLPRGRPRAAGANLIVPGPRFEPVTSPANPAVKRLASLRRSRHRKNDRAFVAEGWREVERAAAAGLAAETLVESAQLHEDPARLSALLPALESARSASPDTDLPRLRLLSLPPELFVKCAYHRDPEGVLAIFRATDWSLDDLLVDPSAPTGPAPLALIAVGCEKPGNLGAMARTAEAAGACAVIAADSTVDPWNPNALRNSTGAVFSTPTVVASREQTLAFPRRLSLRLAAAVAPEVTPEATPEASTPSPIIPHTQADLAGPLAIVVGPEADGLDASWRSAADLLVSIPMAGTSVDSLNVSVAAGVLLFEARRQRDTQTA